jgi:adenylate cyclase
MHINANIDVHLDEEQADEVVVQILKKDYTRIYDDFQVLASKTELEDYEKEDMAHLDAYLSAIETLLKYYTYIGDAEEFILGVKGVYIKE